MLEDLCYPTWISTLVLLCNSGPWTKSSQFLCDILYIPCPFTDHVWAGKRITKATIISSRMKASAGSTPETHVRNKEDIWWRSNLQPNKPSWTGSSHRVSRSWKRRHVIRSFAQHDDVIGWKLSPRYWPFVRGIHRSPVNSPHKGQWRGALMFSFICAWINGWLNNGDAGDLRRHSAHYDVTVMQILLTKT